VILACPVKLFVVERSMLQRDQSMSALPEERALLDSDEDLAARIRRGDDVAFEEMYRRYVKPLAAVGSRILRDPVAGEDVAQTALLNAYRSMRRGTVPLHVKPWLYRIAENVAISAHRARRDVVVDEIDEAAAPVDDSGFDREAWLGGLQSLPPRQRDVYLLRELSGVPSGEAAARLGLTIEQVEQALFAARNRLAEHLRFGGRVDCDSVLELSGATPLRPTEQRALKSHLRACMSCRGAFSKLKLGVLSNVGLWVRQLAGWLAGGGAAPITAKVGAVVAAATLGSVAAPPAIRAIEHSIVPAAAHAAAPDAPAVAASMPAGAARPFSDGSLMLFGMNLPAFLGVPASSRTRPHGGTFSFGDAAGSVPPAGEDPGSGNDAAGDPNVTDQSGADGGSQADEASTDAAATDGADPAATDAAPVDETPPPDEAVPADTPPEDTVPVDTIPADTLPADTVPVDATPVP
jgi:RNA polymerase sigma-70 factor (ECF subfamily)